MKTRNRHYDMSGEDRQDRYEQDEREYEEEDRQERQLNNDRIQEEDRNREHREPSASLSHASGSESGRKHKKKKSRKRREPEPDTEGLSNFQLLSNLTEYFEGRFKEIKREIIEENQVLCNQMSKRFKTSEHTFRKNGNKFQYLHNTEVASKVEEAQTYHERNPPNVKKSRETLNEGMDIIEDRNKDILVADTSEGGWATVHEYKKKPIAEDSDDDKRLKRADTSAVKKLDEKKKKYRQRRHNSYQNNSYNYNNNNYNRNQNQQNYQNYNRRQPQQQYYTDNNYRQYRAPNNNYRREGDCFSCGGTDHWRDDCPVRRNRSSSHYRYNSTN